MRLLNPGFNERSDFEVFRRIEVLAYKLLKRYLPKSEKTLYYHSIEHTETVVKYALKFGRAEGLRSRELLLVAAAALFHDTGYVQTYDKNEYWGARRAQLHLPKYGFTKEETEKVKDIIMATQLHADMKARPRDQLEKVICDADLASVGFSWGKYMESSEALRKEFGIDDEIKWVETQIKFFDAHSFHTRAAQRWGAAQKARNLRRLYKRLKTLKTMRKQEAAKKDTKKEEGEAEETA